MDGPLRIVNLVPGAKGQQPEQRRLGAHPRLVEDPGQVRPGRIAADVEGVRGFQQGLALQQGRREGDLRTGQALGGPEFGWECRRIAVAPGLNDGQHRRPGGQA